MKRFYLLQILTAIVLLTAADQCFAQAYVSGDNIFLKGKYVNIGINDAGAFGSTRTPPDSLNLNYNVSQSFLDSLSGCVSGSNEVLGFIADYGEDGWTVGSPPLYGDYFVPGDPQEGWIIEINGVSSDAFTPNFESNCNGFASFPTAGGPGLSLYGYAATPAIGSSGRSGLANWEGFCGGSDGKALKIDQTAELDSTKLYFLVHVGFKNMSGTALDNIYYSRTLDPDNEEPETGSFTTINSLDYYLPDADNKVLVSAVGTTYGAYLGLGTEDCRAMPYIVNGSLVPFDLMSAVYAQSVSEETTPDTYTGSITEDEGVGIVYSLGNLSPAGTSDGSDSTNITYAYILSEDQLDSAFLATAPALAEFGVPSVSGLDTVNTCSILTDSIPATIINGSNYYWTWTPTHGLTDSVGTNIYVLKDSIQAITTYTVTGTGICDTKTFLLTIYPGKTAVPTAHDTAFCVGSVPGKLRASGTGQLLWYTTDTGGVADTMAPTPSTTTPGVYTWYVSQKTGSCESYRVPITATINASPTVNAVDNAPVCTHDTLVLTALTTAPGYSVTYSWSGPDAFTSTMASPELFNASTAFDGIYTVSMTYAGCPPVTDTASVTVYPGVKLSTYSFTDPTRCDTPNGIIRLDTLTAGETYTVHFVKDGTAETVIATADSKGNLLLTGLSAGNYVSIYAVTPDGCPSNMVGPITLTGASTAAPVGTAQTYCQYTAPSPLYAAGDNLLWYTSSTGGTPTTSLTPSTDAAGSFTYYVTQTVNGCESPRAAVIVTVLPQPAAPAISTNSPICSGSVLTFSTTDVSMGSYLWIGPDDFYSSVENPSFVADSNASGTYTLVTTDNNGCESVPATTDVAVHPIPPPPGTTNLQLCQNDTLNVLPVIGSNLTWYSVPGGSGSAVVPSLSTAGPDSVTYYVTQTVVGCTSDTATETIVVLYKPIAAITTSSYDICLPDSIVLSNTGYTVPGEQYMWTFPSDAVIGSGSTTGPGPLTVNFDSSGNHLVYLAVSNDRGLCATNDTAYINDAALPMARMSISPSDICPGEPATVALSYISANATSFVWDFDGGQATSRSDNSGGPYSVTWNTTGLHVLSLTTFNKEMCPNVGQILDSVVVHDNPGAYITNVSNANICSGDSVMFTASLSEGNNQYEWSPAHYFNNVNSSQIYGRIDLPGYITLTVTSEYGCTAQDSTYINAQPCCNVTFPTAFTPNGDGLNDIFRPITTGNHQIHVFRVVNRWGQTVYSTDQEHAGWDGTFNGVPQDMGVYFYFLKYDCNGTTMEEHGDVTLIR